MVDRLAPQTDGVVISTNRQSETPLRQIRDTHENVGPLGGILAGLHAANDAGLSHIATAAVDTPFFPCDLVPRLILAGSETERGFAIAATKDGPQGTFGLWPTSLIADLDGFIAGGGRKVRQFTEDYGAASALFPISENTSAPDPFFNINTPEDLEAATKWM